jgi:hypothetical protein
MPDSELPSFDDPALKAALRRALVTENAPKALRTRMGQLLADPPVDSAPPPLRITPQSPIRRPFWRQPIWGLAAAAVILVCIGLFTIQFENGHRGAEAMPALPTQFAEALVATHDYCCSKPDHHVLKGVPDDDFRLMTQKLREQLGFPALAVSAGDGWTFKGASPSCKVGGVPSAHLVFKQNDKGLSIFSVAVASETWPDGKPPSDGERFANTLPGHSIMSWVHNDTVYSVVGSSPDQSLDLRTIAPIVDRLRVAIDGADVGGDDGRTSIALR